MKPQTFALLKFSPLFKVDDATHTVYGLVTSETPDKTGEICDYKGAKNAYQKWSAQFSSTTQTSGQEKSLGNIRKQHTPEVAGKAIQIDYDDTAKSISLGSMPIDDTMYEQLKQGFFTGYSQGGDYAWRRCEECGTTIPEGNKCPDCKKAVLVRYAPIIAEVSYVDNPCHPDATFEYVKADGATEMRKFAPRSEPMAVDNEVNEAALVERVTKGVLDAMKKAEDDKAAAEAEKVAKAKKDKEDKPKKAEKATADMLALAEELLAKSAVKLKIGLKKDMYDVSGFAQVLMSLFYLHGSSVYERDSEGDESKLPEELLSLLESAADAFIAMAAEEAHELTSAATGKTGGMQMSETAKTLSKAARKTIADHIASIKGAAKDHMDDVSSKCDKLTKLMGDGEKETEIPVTEDEPSAVDPISAPDYAKGITAADLAKAIKDAHEEGAAEFLKAFKDALAAPAEPTLEKGVGNRDLAIVTGAFMGSAPVTKAEDGSVAAKEEPIVITSEDIIKAQSGDVDAIRKLAKSSRPTSMPSHLQGAFGNR